MDLQEYNKRLKILLDQEVITPKSNEIAIFAFKELLKVLNKAEIDQATMLFTHLPMALTRISKGENVESPAADIINEIVTSQYFPIAKAQVDLIEMHWGNPLPQSEKNYLYMHYSNVINMNLQGGE